MKQAPAANRRGSLLSFSFVHDSSTGDVLTGSLVEYERCERATAPCCTVTSEPIFEDVSPSLVRAQAWSCSRASSIRSNLGSWFWLRICCTRFATASAACFSTGGRFCALTRAATGASVHSKAPAAQANCRCEAHQYFLALGGISDTSTGSNSNFGSSASGAKYAFVVFSQFLSSRSGKSGL